MLVATAFVIACGLLLAAWTATTHGRVARLQRRGAALFHRLDWRQREQQLLATARREAQQTQKQIEDVIDQSTNSVEAIHRAIEGVTFNLWGEKHQRLHTLHGRARGQVYGGIRDTNHRLGRFLSRALGSDNEDDKP